MTADRRPSLARAREKLGGRVTSQGRAGEIVRAGELIGVILFSDDTACDVWIGDDRTKRVAIRDVVNVDSNDASLLAIANDARAFARREEGERIAYDGDVRGQLIEKCRWGGLVARDDGRIFAVGFRRFARDT